MLDTIMGRPAVFQYSNCTVVQASKIKTFMDVQILQYTLYASYALIKEFKPYYARVDICHTSLVSSRA